MGFMNSKLLDRLKQASEMERVYYDERWLREWQNGNRFYLRSRKGGTSDSDTQYFKCDNITTEICPVGFSDRSISLREINTPKQNFSIGSIDSKDVIVSSDPEKFWK
jgi:hypothetical protein